MNVPLATHGKAGVMLFVSGLPTDANEETLSRHIERIDKTIKVKSIVLLRARETMLSRGIAFLELGSPEDGTKQLFIFLSREYPPPCELYRTAWERNKHLPLSTRRNQGQDHRKYLREESAGGGEEQGLIPSVCAMWEDLLMQGEVREHGDLQRIWLRAV